MGRCGEIEACAFVLLASPTVSTSCASRVAMRATCEIRADVGRYGQIRGDTGRWRPAPRRPASWRRRANPNPNPSTNPSPSPSPSPNPNLRHVGRHRGGEEQRLARGCRGAEGAQDGFYRGPEAHVEQLVGLVEDEHLHCTEGVQHALPLEQVDQAARGGDEDGGRPVGEGGDVGGDLGASHHRARAQLRMERDELLRLGLLGLY